MCSCETVVFSRSGRGSKGRRAHPSCSPAEAGVQQQRSLADTPVTFAYAAGDAVRGFDVSSPLARAADTALWSFEWTLAFLLQSLALLWAPALVVTLGWAAWRRLGPRLSRVRREPQ